jgi:primosomal protein N''
MALLTRDAILQAQDLPTEQVHVPEWGGDVLVRALTGAERDRFEQSIVEQRGKSTRMNLQNIRAKLVALTVVDEQGNRIFKDEDVKWLGNKSAAALDRIFEVAQRLSGLRDEDVEELAKNSESDLSDDSTSA